jgi:hypothetical protein
VFAFLGCLGIHFFIYFDVFQLARVLILSLGLDQYGEQDCLSGNTTTHQERKREYENFLEKERKRKERERERERGWGGERGNEKER